MTELGSLCLQQGSAALAAKRCIISQIQNPKSEIPNHFMSLLVVRDLKKHFPVRGGLFSRVREYVKAVDGVTFSIGKAQTLGLVGESGCGKTTVGRAILRLISATSGVVEFEGEDILRLDRNQLREKRRRMQIVFQDPYGSLNPRMTIEQIVGEALEVHGIAHGAELREQVALLLSQVGLRRKS